MSPVWEDMVKIHKYGPSMGLFIAALIGVAGSFAIICHIVLTGEAGTGFFWLFTYCLAMLCVYWQLLVNALTMPRLSYGLSFIVSVILFLPFSPSIPSVITAGGLWFATHYIGSLGVPVLQRTMLYLKNTGIARRQAEIAGEQEIYGRKRLQFVQGAAAVRGAILLGITLGAVLIASIMRGDVWFEHINTQLSLAAGGLGLSLLAGIGAIQFFTRYFIWQADTKLHRSSHLGRGWGSALVVGCIIVVVALFTLPANISPLHNVDWDGTMSRVVDVMFSRMTHPQGNKVADDLYHQPDTSTGFVRGQRGGGGIGSALFPLIYTAVIVGVFSWTLWHVIRFVWYRETMRGQGFFAHLVFIVKFPVWLFRQALSFVIDVWRLRKKTRKKKQDPRMTRGRFAVALYTERADISPELRDVRRMYQHMLTEAEERGWKRKTHQSAQEFSGQLITYVPEATWEIQQLTTAYERARYANVSVSSQRVHHLHNVWSTIREAFRRHGS